MEAHAEVSSPNMGRVIFERSSDGMALCEMIVRESQVENFRFLRVNNAFYNHTGLLKGQVEGCTVLELIPNFNEEFGSWSEIIVKVFDHDESLEVERFSESLNRWFWLHIIPESENKFIVIFRDITSKKDTEGSLATKELELRELNHEYSKMLDVMSDGVVYQNHLGEIDYFNDRALEILNLTKDQLLGRTNFSPDWHTIREDYSEFPPKEHPVYRSLKEGVACENEIMGISVFNGAYRWLSINSTPVLDDKGHVDGVIAVFRDITNLREQSEIIKANQESNAFLFQHSSDLICILDKHGVFEKISESSEEVLGYSPEDLLGSNIDKSIFHEDAESIFEFFQQLENCSTEGRFAYRFHHANGELTWLETVFKPISSNTGEVQEVIATIRNIDQSKSLEVQLRRLNEELNRSNRELTDFAYVASHDLQEPLRMISSFGILLQREYGDLLDEKGLKYLNFTLSGAQRMKRLIDDLLKYSRVNTIEEDLESINICEVINSVVQPYKGSAEYQINVECQSREIKVIPSLIERVVQNLLENALKFKKHDLQAIVNITTREKDGFVELRVEDNGIGINPLFHEKIFRIFQRLHREDDYPGTGIGLSIVKRIVERHGGSIAVESQEGTGSTFIVKLP